MFDRYEIQSQPTQDTASSVDEEHEVVALNHFANIVIANDLEEATNGATVTNKAKLPEQALEESTTTTTATSSSPNNVCESMTSLIQYTISTLLLLFSATLVLAAIVTEQTTMAESTHPVVAVLLLTILILWLAVMEGGQGCLVGLQPHDPNLYADSHPWAHGCTTLTYRNGNLERLIVGRQFLVVLVVFGINMCGSAVADANVLGLPAIVQEIFLASGVALMLLTIVVGQLAAQVNAANCMLDFVNNRFMLVTVWISLAMEASGLMHAVYVVQLLFAKMTGKSFGNQDEATTSVCSKIFFWLRVVLSLAVLGFAFAVTLSALFHGQTAMWEGVPEFASVIIFFVLMCFVGLMEGMQIALFAVVNLPAQAMEQYPIAQKNCQLVFQGSRFQALLIGRQICVTICMFLVARITTIQAPEDGDETIFGVPASVQQFFQTGLLGAVITTIVGSLAWRVVASSFPLAFLSNPVIYVIIRLCLWLEASGVCTAAWLLASLHKHVVGLQTDDVYLGDKAAKGKDATERDSAPSEEPVC